MYNKTESVVHQRTGSGSALLLTVLYTKEKDLDLKYSLQFCIYTKEQDPDL